jgi:hypothetical protein
MTSGRVDRIMWEPWWRLSMGAGVLDDLCEEVSWDLAIWLEEVSWDLAIWLEAARHLLTMRGGPPVLGSLSERRCASATPICAANTAPRPAFNSTRRDPPRASAHSRALGSTARRISPKQPAPGANQAVAPTVATRSSTKPSRRNLRGLRLFLPVLRALPRRSPSPPLWTAFEQRAARPPGGAMSASLDASRALFLGHRGERNREQVTANGLAGGRGVVRLTGQPCRGRTFRGRARGP